MTGGVVPEVEPWVRDDAGTQYQGDIGGGGASDEVIRSESVFVPTPPENATTLLIDLAGDTVELALPTSS